MYTYVYSLYRKLHGWDLFRNFERLLYSNLNWISGKLWTIKDNKLKNDADIWQSNDQWSITNGTTLNETFVYIENSLTNKFLVVVENNTTAPEKIVAQNDRKQMWIKGVPNRDGYFLLTDPESNKTLMAINATSLEIRGNAKR